MFFINKTNMFSILGYVNDRLKINGRYNFLFHYPDDLPEDFFYFKQSSHPLYSTSSSDFSQDFVLNNCELNDTNGREFTGLAKSSSLNSYLDGNINPYHTWYACGFTQSYVKPGRIPGPPCNPLNDHLSQTSDLWLKIDDLQKLNLLSKYANQITNIFKIYSRMPLTTILFSIFCSF